MALTEIRPIEMAFSKAELKKIIICGAVGNVAISWLLSNSYYLINSQKLRKMNSMKCLYFNVIISIPTLFSKFM